MLAANVTTVALAVGAALFSLHLLVISNGDLAVAYAIVERRGVVASFTLMLFPVLPSLVILAGGFILSFGPTSFDEGPRVLAARMSPIVVASLLFVPAGFFVLASATSMVTLLTSIAVASMTWSSASAHYWQRHYPTMVFSLFSMIFTLPIVLGLGRVVALERFESSGSSLSGQMIGVESDLYVIDSRDSGLVFLPIAGTTRTVLEKPLDLRPLCVALAQGRSSP